MASMEERLQQLEARQAIRDLVAEYCRAIDDRDLEAFVGNYTDDCVHRQRDGSLHIEGRAALREHYAARFLQYGVTLHTPHAHVIAFDGPDRRPWLGQRPRRNGAAGRGLARRLPLRRRVPSRGRRVAVRQA